MILYNGTTGSLAHYFAESVGAAGASATPLRSRLEDLDGFRKELGGLAGNEATFVLFAAKVSVPWCESHPEEARQTNVSDTLEFARLFIEACRGKGISPRLLYVSSAHLYARNDGTIHETDPILPRSVYARTKLEAENGLRDLARATGADLRITRVFGLVAPVQPEHYILHAMLKRAREKRMRGIPGLSNLRDYLDSRDVCRAILKTISVEEANFARVCPDRILNVCSGRGISIRALAEACVKAISPADEAARLISEMTEAPPRADDVPRIVGSIDRYRALFGEDPGHFPIETTIRDAIGSG